MAFEIAAVDLSLIWGGSLLFVCPGCGLTNAETQTEARLKLNARITELRRMLMLLKLRI
jgi:hypothetical protein